MWCPSCGSDDSRVVDSRTVEGGVRRRRECLGCLARFTTYERIEVAPLLVVKRDGRREPFSREKLLAGLRRACEKRPLAAGAVEALADAVERGLHGRAVAEVPSTAIGEMLMEGLESLDEVAYVRFASVYRSFADLESLKAMLDELLAARLRGTADTPRDLIAGGPGGQVVGAALPPRPRRRWRDRKARDAVPR
jgi:transcriptional repressor NrdR